MRPKNARHIRTITFDGGLISPFMHSECKRVRTDPIPIICYSQRHSIRPGWDTSVFGH